MDRDLDIEVDLSALAEIVNGHPGFARAMVNLHRRYRITTAQLAAATEEAFPTAAAAARSPCPTKRFATTSTNANYLHELDTAAEDLTTRMRMHHGDLAGELSRRLTEVHGMHINKRIDLGDTVLHRYDPATKTLKISNHLSSGQQVFKMAAELAYLEFGDLIHAYTDGKFTSDESRTLARLGLANYFAAAAVLPYRQFHDVAENFRYDVERLSAFYSVSYETICHRLSTLQRPSMRGVRSRSSASARPGTCQNVSRPPVSISPPAAGPARCGTSTRLSPTRARSWCRSPRCPTAAITCGWPGPWSGGHHGMVSPVRPSRSGLAGNSGTPTDSSTRKDSTCPAISPRRSAQAAGSANATTAHSARSPLWAGHSTSTSTAARYRPILVKQSMTRTATRACEERRETEGDNRSGRSRRREVSRSGADQLDRGEVRRPYRRRAPDAPVRHAGSAQAAVLVDAALLRRAAAGPVAAGRHRVGDPTGRAFA